MTLLAGLHDIEAFKVAPKGSWVLDTLALSENPTPRDYASIAPGLNVIVRANWNYGSTGTLPVPDQYPEYVKRLANYVSGSRGCTRWIVGNEPNLPREWPDGQPIMPRHYATCYIMARAVIHALPGHEHDEVLIAASGPWNDELKYEGNPNGDWIKYFEDVITACGNNIDGFSIHSYTHGYNVALVTSSARMQAPFQSRHYEFRTYRDYMEVIPQRMRHLPVYLTEANGNGPWQAVGLIPAMLNEIDNWNKSGAQPIKALIFYRFPRYDDFYMQGRGDVMAEFQQATSRYSAPATTATAATTPQETLHMPQVSAPVDWDERLTVRGVTFTPAQGQHAWRVTKAQWLDESQAGGRHHIYVDLLDEAGNRAVDVPLMVYWPGGSARIVTEAKPGEPYSANFAMSSSLNEFSIRVDDGTPSDVVGGIGMGADGNKSIHTSTALVLQRKAAQMTQPTQLPSRPPQDSLTPSPVEGMPPLAQLVRPTQGTVTQRWGENSQNYARFGIPGHNGLDVANSAGTPILSVADGTVAFVGTDTDYGIYVRISHPQLGFDSFYAHLQAAMVTAGERVTQGKQIGAMGTTGNSTGNHVHLELRLSNGSSYVNLSGGFGKGRFDPAIAYWLLNRETI